MIGKLSGAFESACENWTADRWHSSARKTPTATVDSCVGQQLEFHLISTDAILNTHTPR